MGAYAGPSMLLRWGASSTGQFLCQGGEKGMHSKAGLGAVCALLGVFCCSLWHLLALSLRPCRDLKLDNTLLDTHTPPRLKLCDFGFAKHWQVGG